MAVSDNAESLSIASVANGIPVADDAGKLANGWLNTGTGNGLDADTVDGAHASATPTVSTIPIADGAGKLPAGWGGSASGLATLNSSSKVVEDPANATATPTASKIPIADGSGKLDVGWLPQGLAVADATDAASVILRLNELLAQCRLGKGGNIAT